MYRKIALTLLVVLGVTALLIAQDPGTRTAYIWLRDVGGHHFVPLSGGVTVAADGRSASIAAGQSYSFGSGFVTADPGTGTIAVELDSAYVLYRAQPPAGPGSCSSGTGAIAAADGYLYVCVPDGTAAGYQWARTPMETAW